MSKVVTVSNDSIVMEITKPLLGFTPRVGGLFYVPDLMSLRAPVKELVWAGSESDYMLFYDNMVFEVPEFALERYQLLKALIRFLDN